METAVIFGRNGAHYGAIVMFRETSSDAGN